MPAPLRFRRLPFPRVLCALALLALAACAGLPSGSGDAQLNASAWARANQLPLAADGPGWRHQGIGSRPVSVYTPGLHAGRPALHAHSERGDSVVRLPLAVDGTQLGRLHFSWYVNALNPLTDLADSQLDDAVARIILQFSGDRSGFTPRDHRLSDLLQLTTGEPLPDATLIYVWDHRYPVGTVIPHARSQRIKLMVIESGDARLGRWVDFERDVATDYRTAFGQTPQRLKGIALMTDSNNTGQAARAWYGPLRWSPPPT